MTRIIKVLFLTGGPSFHPVAAQAERLAQWAGAGMSIMPVGREGFFEKLREADLTVVGGLHWTGSPGLGGGEATPYRSPSERERQNWRDYVASGKPVCGFHGGIASFDDWPEFGRLLGFQWLWGYTAHSRVDRWSVQPCGAPHAVTRKLEPFMVVDELYYNICVQPDMEMRVRAEADYHGVKFPMLMTGQGGRCPGAGKTAYIANGHDLRAFEAPMLRLLILQTLRWLAD